MYKAYITYVKNIRPAENSDFLNACEVFGNTTIIDKTITEDTLVLYLPSDGQISIEFGEKNNLFRKKDDAGNNIGGFVDPVKRNITAIRLRGNRSDGLVLPISCLNYCYTHGDASAELHAGDIINGTLNGHEICCKYIPRRDHRQGHVSDGNRTRKKKVDVAPLFAEHADTEQLAYNLGAFKPGDEIEITLKMHGTSQRTGYLPVLKGWKVKNKFFQGIVNKYASSSNLSTFARKCVDIVMRDATPIYDWSYVSGTRRTVLENYDGGYYGSNEFREQHSKTFEGKLWKGETVYYEVVGFTHTGAPIMEEGNNEKLGKDFVKQYGKTTVFSYGCDPEGEFFKHEYSDCWDGMNVREFKPQSDIYVYRMTMTNEDGNVVEYSPDFMRYRCEQMGVKCVPVFAKATIDGEGVHIYAPDNELYGFVHETNNAGDTVKLVAEKYYDGPDPIGKTHIREGVVVRIVNRPKFTAFKHKNFDFKVLSNIAIEQAIETGAIEKMSDDEISEL